MTKSLSAATLAAILLGMTAVMLSPAPDRVAAEAAPNSCRATLHFDDAPYGLLAKGVSCRFAHRWAVSYQRTGTHPRHWTCVGRGEFTEEGSCQDRRGADYFLYYIEN